MTQLPALYPLLLEPVLHTKVWGGRRLQTALNKNLPTDEPYGESWEMHDTARIANGALAGQTIGEVLATYGTALIGNHDPANGMPLLAKFLDAEDWLSVQVHPDDAQAARLEGEPRGKTEAWYVVDAEPGAQLIIGVEGSREQVAEAINAGTLEERLVYTPVQKGSVLFVAAGTVHALGPGILIYEIQQSSDRTYRLYDWGRMGLDGNPRPLHIEKSLEVANFGFLPKIHETATDESAAVDVVRSPFFNTVLHRLDGDAVPLPVGDVFHILTCIAGKVAVTVAGERLALLKGQSALIPASLTAFALEGDGEVLRSWPGEE